MNTNRAEWIGMLASVCMLLGALLALTVKTQQRVRIGVPLVTSSVELSQEWEMMQNKIQLLQHKLNDFHGRVDPSSETGEAEMLAGMVPVTGPGVVVTLNDNPQLATARQNGLLNSSEIVGGMVHDFDILRVVNELNAAGAEAISINNQRYGPRTAIRCVGPVTNVNQVAVGAPFRIQAVGDPVSLEAAMNLPGGVIQELKGVGCQVAIERRSRMLVPAFDGAVLFRYARQQRHDLRQGSRTRGVAS